MLVHSVRFWLRSGISSEDRDRFRWGLESLAGIPDVRQLFVGRPAATPPRPVVEADYDFALTVVLDDVASHNRYQDHPLHQAFVREFQPLWTRVAVFDAS